MHDHSLPSPHRRLVLGGLLAAGMSAGRAVHAESPARLFAGTYANEGGAGLVPLTGGGGRWQAGVANPEIRNVSFGVTRGGGRLRYLLDEQTQGGLGIYDARFRRLAGLSTGGADPCHAALAPGGRALAVANYSSGSVALWALDPATGMPQGSAQIIAHTGHGPNTERQAGPHAHWVGFTSDGAILHSVDLGADAVFAHHRDAHTGRVVRTSIAYQAPPGTGPRHLARHPHLSVAYLVTELANTVTVLDAASDGGFVERGILSTLPADFRGTSYGAHIALNPGGTRLYVSNRGHDSIAVYAIGSDGGLQLIQHAACGGHWPRFFRLQGKGMLVANQRAGTITHLPLRDDGTLGQTAIASQLPGVVFVGD